MNPRIPRSNIITTTTSKKRVPNPLIQLSLLMVTKEKKLKIRRLTNIETFVENMVMMSGPIRKDANLQSIIL